VLVSWLALGERPKEAAVAGGAVMLAGVVWMAVLEATRVPSADAPAGGRT